MNKFLRFVFISLVVLCGFSFTTVQPASAADIRANQSVIIGPEEKGLRDLYIFGQTVRIDAPVENDAVAAGQDLSFNSDVSGSIIAAGANLYVKGNTGNTVRIAGGTITVDGKTARDLIIAGGNINVTKNAAVGGDAVVNGGQVTIDSPVQGKLVLNAGNAVINGTVNGNVESANVGKLTLGPNARINGDLTYSSTEKASIDPKAVVSGKTTYHYVEKQKEYKDETRNFLTFGSIYKLLADIIISVLFILFFARFILNTLRRMTETPLKSGAIGFAYLLLFPILSAIALVLVWLGIGSFLFYALSILVTLFLVGIFIGWMIMRWYERNQKREYVLDWKAGVVGPIVLYVLMLIPILGWLTAAVIFVIALGAMLETIIAPLSSQKLEARTGGRKK